MFEPERLGGGQERSIRLDTHLGNPIRNIISPDVGDAECLLYKARQDRYGARWINRKPATGVYNCYGMIFASRRTSIFDDEHDTAINRILDDDGYRKLPETDARVGDIVLYRDVETQAVFHVAVVTRRDPFTNGAGAALTRGPCHALSKWNDTCGEDEHHVQQHCWTDFDMGIEYWTDRP